MTDSKDSKEAAPAAAKVELSGKKVQITANDDTSFTVPLEHALQSDLLKTMLGDASDVADADEDTGSSAEEPGDIPLPNVTGPILKMCLAFMAHHFNNKMKQIDKPLKSANMEDVVDKWDADFVSEAKGVTQEILFKLILAANYLNVTDLLDLTCAKVASLIKGKTPEEIRKTFNITEKFTPEEEAKVRKDNPWLEEA